MKILPDYLIELMPAIEQAIEELRLSVLDHAYDLLNCLDIDELTTDDIRNKLELYNIKVENMTEDWLPNGRFYRIYPLIKHNRTRLNGLASVVKSGGQFEGLWSDKFSKTNVYNYKSIQMLRHYDLASNADGYFYISGDVSQTSYGQVTDSAVTALSSDILLSQSMPAGYTYLYVPWPRPHYPADSTYFYNVHMLQYSRLHYALSCDDLNNSDKQYSTSTPASEIYYSKYTQYKNKFTIAPYWFDYHYIDENIFNKTDDYWPIEHEFDAVRSGNIILKNEADETIIVSEDATNEQVNAAINEAVSYFVNTDISDNPYKIISNSNASFPTACYIYTKNNTTVPNRLQTFNKFTNTYTLYLTSIGSQRLRVVSLLINKFKYTLTYANTLIASANLPIILLNNTTDYSFAVSLKNDIEAIGGSALIDENNNINERYLINIISHSDDTALKNYLVTKFNISSSYIDNIISTLPIKLPVALTYDSYSYAEALQVQSELQGIGVVADIIQANVYTIDENYPEISNEPGPYRWDVLNSKVLSIREDLNHIKTYKSVWSESSPIFANMQSNNIDRNHSLYYWFKAKQDNNIMEMSVDTIQYNDPAVSEITHTSYDRPTISRLDPIYVGYTNSSNIGQNKTLSTTITLNSVYNDSAELLTYDPTLYYNLIGLGTYSNSNQELIENDLSLYLVGDPSTNTLYINLNNDENDTCNYVTYKTSKLHKLSLSSDDSNISLSVNSVNSLYRNGNNQLYCYSDNTKSFEYDIVGVYGEDGTLVNNVNDLVCSVFTCDSKYYNYIINNSSTAITAAYILFTVKVFNQTKEAVDTVVLNTETSESKIAKYLAADQLISIDDGETFITLTTFYANGWEFVAAVDRWAYNTNTNNFVSVKYMSANNTVSFDNGETYISYSDFTSAGWIFVDELSYELKPMIDSSNNFYVGKYNETYGIVTVDNGTSYSLINNVYSLLNVTTASVYQQSTSTATKVTITQSSGQLSDEQLTFDDWENYMSTTDFYNDGWIITKYVKTLFLNNKQITIYGDDYTGDVNIDSESATFTINTDTDGTWSFN